MSARIANDLPTISYFGSILSRSRAFSSRSTTCWSALRSVTENAIGVERLLEDVVRAELRRLDRGLDGGVAADHHDDRRRIDLANALERLEPVDAAHLHVHEDQIRMPLLVLGDRVDGVLTERTS